MVPLDHLDQLVADYGRLRELAPRRAEVLQNGGYFLVNARTGAVADIRVGDEAYRQARAGLSRVRNPGEQMRARRTQVYRGADPRPENPLPGEFLVVMIPTRAQIERNLRDYAINPSLLPDHPALRALKAEAQVLFDSLDGNLADRWAARVAATQRTEQLVSMSLLRTAGSGGGGIVLNPDGSLKSIERDAAGQPTGTRNTELWEEYRLRVPADQRRATYETLGYYRFTRENGDIVIIVDDVETSDAVKARILKRADVIRNRLASFQGQRQTGLRDIVIELNNSRVTYSYDDIGNESAIQVERRRDGEWATVSWTRLRYADANTLEPAVDTFGNRLFDYENVLTREKGTAYVDQAGLTRRRETGGTTRLYDDFALHAESEALEPRGVVILRGGEPVQVITSSFQGRRGDTVSVVTEIETVWQNGRKQHRVLGSAVEVRDADGDLKQRIVGGAVTQLDLAESKRLARLLRVDRVEVPVATRDARGTIIFTYDPPKVDEKARQVTIIRRGPPRQRPGMPDEPGAILAEDVYEAGRVAEGQSQEVGMRLAVSRFRDGETRFFYDRPNPWNLHTRVEDYVGVGDQATLRRRVTLVSPTPDTQTGLLRVRIERWQGGPDPVVTDGFWDTRGRDVDPNAPDPVPVGDAGLEVNAAGASSDRFFAPTIETIHGSPVLAQAVPSSSVAQARPRARTSLAAQVGGMFRWLSAVIAIVIGLAQAPNVQAKGNTEPADRARTTLVTPKDGPRVGQILKLIRQPELRTKEAMVEALSDLKSMTPRGVEGFLDKQPSNQAGMNATLDQLGKLSNKELEQAVFLGQSEFATTDVDDALGIDDDQIRKIIYTPNATDADDIAAEVRVVYASIPAHRRSKVEIDVRLTGTDAEKVTAVQDVLIDVPVRGVSLWKDAVDGELREVIDDFKQTRDGAAVAEINFWFKHGVEPSEDMRELIALVEEEMQGRVKMGFVMKLTWALVILPVTMAQMLNLKAFLLAARAA